MSPHGYLSFIPCAIGYVCRMSFLGLWIVISWSVFKIINVVGGT